MVRAILDGRKTVTRRAIKHQPDVPVTDAIPHREYPHGPPSASWYWRPRLGHRQSAPSAGWDFKCPFGQPGDWLWGRETWQSLGIHEHLSPSKIPPGSDVQYPATYDGWVSKHRPSIHMPRWASRILLEITDVRVERLHEIRNDSARAEGYPADREAETGGGGMDPWIWFRQLWKQRNGAEGWDANPWVWVVEFRRITE